MKHQEILSNVLKPFICGIMISCLCLCSAPIYSNAAGSTYGAKKYATINGVSFTMQNSLYTGREGNDNHKYGRAYTDVEASINLQGGFLGTTPVLYYSSGTIAKWGATTYTSGYSAGIATYAEMTYFTNSPTFYSHGYVEIWDGYDYQDFRPYKTANLNNYTW